MGLGHKHSNCFLKILSKYLGHCSAQDRLLLIALEQFVHLLLFGDELCVEAVRMKAVDNLLAIGMTPSISPETLKLLLRALAVLCGTAKGCLQLISVGTKRGYSQIYEFSQLGRDICKFMISISINIWLSWEGKKIFLFLLIQCI
jgi:hypothetical protein